MKLIYKYKIDLNKVTILELPYNSDILDIQVQNGEIVMWASVDLSHYLVKLKLQVFVTGSTDVPSHAEHIATFQMGWFVGHVFEV